MLVRVIDRSQGEPGLTPLNSLRYGSMAHCYWKYYGDVFDVPKVKDRSRDHKSDSLNQRLSFFVARASVSSTLPAAKLTFSSPLSGPSVSLQKAFLRAHRGSGSTVGTCRSSNGTVLSEDRP